MKHIHTFESFLNESRLHESHMSELDLIRQDAKTLQQFIKDAKEEFPQIAKMKDADEFLEELWELGKEWDKENI